MNNITLAFRAEISGMKSCQKSQQYTLLNRTLTQNALLGRESGRGMILFVSRLVMIVSAGVLPLAVSFLTGTQMLAYQSDALTMIHLGCFILNAAIFLTFLCIMLNLGRYPSIGLVVAAWLATVAFSIALMTFPGSKLDDSWMARQFIDPQRVGDLRTTSLHGLWRTTLHLPALDLSPIKNSEFADRDVTIRLSGKSFRNADFSSGADFRKVFFADVDLTGARFDRSDLTGATFSCIDKGTRFDIHQIVKDRTDQFPTNDLDSEIAAGIRRSQRDARCPMMIGTSFREARLTDVAFQDVVLAVVDMSNPASIDRIKFVGATLVDVLINQVTAKNPVVRATVIESVKGSDMFLNINGDGTSDGQLGVVNGQRRGNHISLLQVGSDQYGGFGIYNSPVDITLRGFSGSLYAGAGAVIEANLIHATGSQVSFSNTASFELDVLGGSLGYLQIERDQRQPNTAKEISNAMSGKLDIMCSTLEDLKIRNLDKGNELLVNGAIFGSQVNQSIVLEGIDSSDFDVILTRANEIKISGVKSEELSLLGSVADAGISIYGSGIRELGLQGSGESYAVSDLTADIVMTWGVDATQFEQGALDPKPALVASPLALCDDNCLDEPILQHNERNYEFGPLGERLKGDFDYFAREACDSTGNARIGDDLVAILSEIKAYDGSQ